MAAHSPACNCFSVSRVCTGLPGCQWLPGTNVTGSMLCCREAIRLMKSQPESAVPVYHIYNCGFSSWCVRWAVCDRRARGGASGYPAGVLRGRMMPRWQGRLVLIIHRAAQGDQASSGAANKHSRRGQTPQAMYLPAPPPPPPRHARHTNQRRSLSSLTLGWAAGAEGGWHLVHWHPPAVPRDGADRPAA